MYLYQKLLDGQRTMGPYSIELDKEKDCLQLHLPIGKNWIGIAIVIVQIIVLVALLFSFSNILKIAWAEINDPYSEVESSPRLAIVVFLPFFLLSLLFLFYLVYVMIAQFVGKEILIFSSEEVRISRSDQFPLKPRRFDPHFISHVHVKQEKTDLLNRIINEVRKPGRMAFFYGAAEVQFGNGITQEEASNILNTILQHFPQYR